MKEIQDFLKQTKIKKKFIDNTTTLHEMFKEVLRKKENGMFKIWIYMKNGNSTKEEIIEGKIIFFNFPILNWSKKKTVGSNNTNNIFNDYCIGIVKWIIARLKGMEEKNWTCFYKLLALHVKQHSVS